jgi:hypothetical protein
MLDRDRLNRDRTSYPPVGARLAEIKAGATDLRQLTHPLDAEIACNGIISDLVVDASCQSACSAGVEPDFLKAPLKITSSPSTSTGLS